MIRFADVVVWMAALLAAGWVEAQVQFPLAPSAGAAGADDYPPCQILDKAGGSQYALSLGYVAESRLKDYEKTSLIELQGTWEFAYYRDVLLADVDLRLDGGVTLMDAGGVDLPDQVLALAVNGGITWRYVNNTALQLRARPGIYSDLSALDADSLYVPFSGSLIWAVHPELSGLVGVEVRPGFERSVLPLARLEWEASADWRVSAGFPRSRVTYYGLRDCALYGGLDWRSDTFSLDDSGEVDREQLTFEDFRLYGGLAYSVSAELQVIGEAGMAFDRSIEFEKAPEDQRRDIDIASDLFVRVGVVGPF